MTLGTSRTEKLRASLFKRQPIKIDQRETESTARSFPGNRTCSIFNQLVYSRHTVQILRTFFFFSPNVANQFVTFARGDTSRYQNASSAHPVVRTFMPTAPGFPRFFTNATPLSVLREKYTLSSLKLCTLLLITLI